MEIFNFNNETVMMYLITAVPLYVSGFSVFIFIRQIKKDEIEYQDMGKDKKPFGDEVYILMLPLCFIMSFIASFLICIFLAYLIC